MELGLCNKWSFRIDPYHYAETELVQQQGLAEPVPGPAEPLCSGATSFHTQTCCAQRHLAASGNTGALAPPHGFGESSPLTPSSAGQLTYQGGLLLHRLSWHSLYPPDWSEPLQQREWMLWLKSQAWKHRKCFQTAVHLAPLLLHPLNS